jgi:hypothetical protein
VLGLAFLAGFVWLLVHLFRKGRTGWAIAVLLGPPIALVLALSFLYLRMARVVVHEPARFMAADRFDEWQAGAGELAGSGSVPSEKRWVLEAGGSRQMQSLEGGLFKVKLPGPGGELVGYSGLEPTPEEALQAARLALARQVEWLVRLELERKGRSAFSPEVEAEVQRTVEQYVAQPHLEADRHLSEVKLPTSGATAHRAAVLLKLPREGEASVLAEEVLLNLRRKLDEERSRRSHLLSTLFSALLLGLVIFLLYSFLNAGSRGHLAWPLRIVSLAAFAALCLGLLYFRGHLP